MTNKINKKFLFLLLTFISLIIISAFVIEYQLGHKPCSLCIYERIPYFISIFLILKILLNTNYQKITLFILFLVFSCLAVGLPTFTAKSCVFFITPNVPP